MILFLAVVSLGGGIATATITALHPLGTPTAVRLGVRAEVVTWLVSSVACDVLLTASLVYLLWTRKTNIISESLDSYINKIICLTVQTGLITTAAALLDVILFHTIHNSTWNFMFGFPLSKLYTNSLINTLNARPWEEQVSHHEAPNALFEQSNPSVREGRALGITSISLVQRRPSESQTVTRQSYMTHPHPYPYPQPPKFDVDIDSSV